MIKKRIAAAVCIAGAAAVSLWIIVDILFNGTVRDYAYNELLDQFSQGWEHFRIVLYLAFALVIFLIILVYFIIPYITIRKYKKHEQEKLKKYIISFFENREIPDMDTDYLELKEVLLTQKLQFEESEQKRNVMISDIAHDLKTPLTSILGYLALLQDALVLPENIREKYTRICYDKAEQMNVLISEFFELSQYIFETAELNKSEIDLTQLIEQIADESFPMLEKSGLNIKFRYDKFVRYYCDGSRISRAFENIIQNAINYSSANSTIDIVLSLSKDAVITTVSNSCRPISRAQLSRIFDRSFRIDPSHNEPGHGGLGLSIAKEIIEAHGGDLSADYSDGIFSVKIILPVYQ